MRGRIRYCVVALAAASIWAIAAQAGYAGLTLTGVAAVDPENDPGLLRYDFEYTNDSESDHTFAVTLNVAKAEGGGGPKEDGWVFRLVQDEETRPPFAVWYARSPEDWVAPAESLHGLYVLSRAKVGPTPWAAALREGEEPYKWAGTQQGDVLGPVAAGRIRQVVPPPLLDRGWNWISFPLVPKGEVGGFDPATVLGANVARLDLFRYHPLYKMFQYYPDDFTEVYVGGGYELWVRAGRVTPNYFGLLVPPKFEIPVPMAGWSLIGHPRNHPLPLAAVAVRDDDTGEVRSPFDDEGNARPWLNWNWVYWDSVEDEAQILRPDDEADDAALRPWLSYWVWANRDRLTIIVP